VDEDDDDRKLPVKREVSWEEEEEEEEEEDEAIDWCSLVGLQNDGLDHNSLVMYASRPTMAFIPSPYRPLSPLSSPSTFDDIEGGVPCTSPSDIIYYLDREHSDEGLGVFRLLKPEMKTENLELWIYYKITDLTSMATSTSEGGVLQDQVFVDEVEQDHSNLEDQFVEEVCSGSNDLTVLTPPNFNEDAYANKLVLYTRHQCVLQSPESIKAIEERDVFFQDVVNSRNITHLRGLPTIRHQIPREKPDNLALRNGSTQNHLYGHYHVTGDDPNDDRYFNPETGEGENQTFKVPFDFVNDALVHLGDSKLTADQIVDRFGNMLNCVPPRKVNGCLFDWENMCTPQLLQTNESRLRYSKLKFSNIKSLMLLM
jgi:hypothetical protein